jgi:hypothetical protein
MLGGAIWDFRSWNKGPKKEGGERRVLFSSFFVNGNVFFSDEPFNPSLL